MICNVNNLSVSFFIFTENKQSEPEARGACRDPFSTAAGGERREKSKGAAVGRDRGACDEGKCREPQVGSPSAPAKKQDSQRLSCFLSNPKDWYVIPRKRVCNRRQAYVIIL